MAVNVNKNLIEVTLPNKQAFLKIKETLTRIGIASHKSQTLFQTAHILHKRGKYYIVHFKQLFEMDGRQATMSDDDYKRVYVIATLLEQWQLLTIVQPQQCDINQAMATIKVIPFGEKEKWKLVPKYQIGIKHYN